MVRIYQFKVLGNPVAQGRPRFARVGKFVRTYDPSNSKNWKETVKWQAIEHKKQGYVIEGAIGMTLMFFLPRPKSLPKRIQEHTKKPDLDNLSKAIKDALKGICYKDDSQIINLLASKQYGIETGVEIIICEKREKQGGG